MVVLGIAIVAVLLRIFVPSFFARLTTPIFVVGNSLSHGFSGIGAQFTDKATLVAQRDAAIAAQESLAAQNETLAAKATDLQKLLGVRAQASVGVLAAVLARPPVSAYDELVVDAGSVQGIAPNASVYGDNGVPVGTISSVTAHAARVMLYSSPGRQTNALIGGSHTPVMLTGNGAGTFTGSVPRDASVAVGDAVYVSGSGSLAIGTILAIDRSPSSPSATIHVKPYVSPFTIAWVTISPAP
jgi:cell shape-determining protein MreC